MNKTYNVFKQNIYKTNISIGGYFIIEQKKKKQERSKLKTKRKFLLVKFTDFYF